MHGLICKSLEGFVIDQHGPAIWSEICRRAGAPQTRFEALQLYDDALIARLLKATASHLGRAQHAVCEDVGHWVCTHPPLEAIRRLIRFSGATFVDLLYALEEMHDRARMAINDIEIPRFQVTEPSPGRFRVESRWMLPGGGAALTGILRAMADDYGALAMIEKDGRGRIGGEWREVILVRVVDKAFHEPREFRLGGGG